MSTTQKRPPHVTMAAGMVIGGSVFVILGVFESLGSLRSLESREGIERFLSQPPGSGMGLDVEGVISLLHITSMVAAGCAAATAILGWHVLKRDLKARIALSILAVPLFISGLVTGGFISSLVAASVAVLWMPPAREWFRSGSWTPPAPREKRPATSRSADQQPGAWPPMPPLPPQNDKDAGPPPQQTPYGMPRQGATVLERPLDPQAGPPVGQRPRALVLAFVITVVFAVMAALMAGLSTVAMLVAPDAVMDELTRQRPDLVDQGVTSAMVRATTIALGALVVVWSVLAVVLGTLALTGRDWARVGLMVSAGATLLSCLVMAFAAPALLVPAAAAVMVLLNLRRPEVRAWSRDHGPRAHRP